VTPRQGHSGRDESDWHGVTGMTDFLMLLAGGVGLFLLGMWLMTEGLKLASGSALRTLLETWTREPSRGFAAGFFITALVQSSSATTVATIGFVNAGLLTLSQAIWVVIGANVGTTMTGWIVALLGIKVQMSTVAMPLVGIGMLIRLTGRTGSRASGIGQAIAGFGTFFLGIGVLQEGFANLAPLIASVRLDDAGLAGMVLSLLLGTALTVVTQSSSAAVAITLTATTMGSIPPEIAAAVVIGTNIGTTSTAIFAGFSATPAAKRVATAHVLFNLLTACLALVLISPLQATGSQGFSPEKRTCPPCWRCFIRCSTSSAPC
jgi:phosphate:Na+ symporter